MSDSVDLGERRISFYDVTVFFDETNTISFYDKDGHFLCQLQPADLSTIYHAYIGMKKELKKENSLKGGE